MKIVYDEKGVTLVELLIAIMLFGLISLAVVNMYRAAMMNWSKSSSQAMITHNTINAFRYLSADIHESSQIIRVRKNYVLMAKGKNKVRYVVNTQKKNVSLIREKLTTHSKWRQDPLFPVAEYGRNGLSDIASISFKRLTSQNIHVEISVSGSKFQTTITKRSAM